MCFLNVKKLKADSKGKISKKYLLQWFFENILKKTEKVRQREWFEEMNKNKEKVLEHRTKKQS